MTNDRPLTLPAPGIRALLEGRKTQHRVPVGPGTCTVLGARVTKKSSAWLGLKFDHPKVTVRNQSTVMRTLAGVDAPADLHFDVPFIHPDDAAAGHTWDDDQLMYRVRPIVEVGDRLWVRETFTAAIDADGGDFGYAADFDADAIAAMAKLQRWWAGTHMLRKASRLTLTVTDVRLQRLHEITPDDAAAEGLYYVEDGPGAGFWLDDRTGTLGVCGDGSVEAYAQLWDRLNRTDRWDTNPWVVTYTFTVERRNIAA